MTVLSNWDSITNQLNSDFFKDSEKYKHKSKISNVLKTMFTEKSYQEQVEAAVDCLYEFWRHYSSEHLAKVLKDFAKVQTALFGFELGEPPQRYRDHFLHMFNVFIFGAIILSLILDETKKYKSDQKVLEKLFKVQCENTKFPFDEPYDQKERLFFIWTLISTFHDVGIPIEHLERIENALNNFMDYFGLKIHRMKIELDASITSQLNYYFDLLGKMFDSGIHPSRGVYHKSDKTHPFLYTALFRAYDEKDHGIMSALALFRGIEETFFIKKINSRPELDLSLDKAKNYRDFVFEQDITRAALAMAVHNLNPQRYPRVFPIKFSKLPLTFLLILCDELQEFFRLEGLSLKGITQLKQFPTLTVFIKTTPPELHIKMNVHYQKLKIGGEEIIKYAQAYAREKGGLPPSNFEEVVSMIYEEICKRLDSKLSFDKYLRIEINVYLCTEKGDVTLLKSWKRPHGE